MPPLQPDDSTSAEAMPRIMFEPARFATVSIPAACTTLRRSLAVVVFPFVPVTSTLPCPRLEASPLMISGSMRSATSPGSAVPPPSRKRRDSPAATLAAAMAAVRLMDTSPEQRA
jgi:hypothetical protein